MKKSPRCWTCRSARSRRTSTALATSSGSCSRGNAATHETHPCNATYEGVTMMMHATSHLTADELDGLLERHASERVTSHLATCGPCTELVAFDRRLVTAISALPLLGPAPGFEDRVMSRVKISALPAAALVVERTPRELAARRRAIGTSLIAACGLAMGFEWAAAHPTQALHWAGPTIQGAGDGFWFSIQTWAAHLSDQAWYASARDVLAAPARVCCLHLAWRRWPMPQCSPACSGSCTEPRGRCCLATAGSPGSSFSPHSSPPVR